MKIFNKTSVLAMIAGLFIFSACEKADPLTVYPDGIATVLSASTATVAPAPIDSNKVALTLSWTDPKYGQDSSLYKYLIEVDSSGRDFAKAKKFIVTGKRTYSFLAKEINAILLSYDFDFNKAYDVDVRLSASYGNNNEQKKSNTLKLRMTPYKVPPKIALPESGRLFIVGDATTFGWDNNAAPPSFPPIRELTRIDETTWGGVYNFTGSSVYKILQTQGVWGTQFHMLDGGTAYAGSFEQRDADPGFPSPNPGGWHLLILNFQKGTYTVTTDELCPDDLWLTGDAVGGWTNTPSDGNKLTRLTNGEFEIEYTWASTPSGAFKFLSNQGQWQPQFGQKKSSTVVGELGANYGGSDDPDAIPAPATAGTYKIKVNFVTKMYSVTKQ